MKHTKTLIIIVLIIIIIGTNILYETIKPDNNYSYDSPKELNTGWEYIIDNSKTKKAIAQHSDNNIPQSGWNDFSYEGGKLFNNGEVLWLKTVLPAGDWANPSIYFNGFIADSAIIYINSNKLCNIKATDSMYNSELIKGYFIELPDDYAGKTLYIRLESGQKGALDKQSFIKIGSQRDLLKDLLNRDISKFVFGYLFLIIFLGIIVVSIFLRKLEIKALYSLCLLSLFVGIFNLTRNLNTFDLFFSFNSNLRSLFNDLAILLLPIPFIYFFSQVFGNKKIYNILYLVHLIIAVALVPIAQLSIANHQETIVLISNILQLLFCLVGLIDFSVIIYSSIRASFNGNPEAKIYSVGLIICIITLLYETLFHKSALHWGFFAFILCQLLILARRYYLRLEQYSRELRDKNEELSTLNKNLEQLVAARTASINNLLNNAGQGFLAFGRELTVFQEYSSQCLDIFNEKIENKYIADLIAQGDQEQKKFLENIFSCILNEKDQDRKKLYLGLLPAEKLINGKHIKLEYKLTRDTADNPDENIMLILTDVTEEKYFEHKAESERNTLKMVIKVVLNLNDFTECLKEYRNFCRYGVNEILRTSSTVKNIISEIYKNVHTFKGNFSIFEMMHSVNNLHNAEEEIVTLSRNSSQLHTEDIERVLSGLKLDTLLDEDMGILYEVLGERFIVQDNTIPVEKQRLLEIERHMSELLNEEHCAELLPVIRKLRYKPINELLKIYPDYSIRLSDRLQKPIYPFTIEGGDIQVDTDRYSDFSRSLVHIFRNALDHGIEPMEQRAQCGKNEYGNIKCTIELVKGEIVICISDDGRGIDIEKVRHKALEKSIYTPEGIAKASKQELLDLIFIDEFSTKEIVNELSGRGVGLSAAKSEIEKLNGRIELHTAENKGTEFRFYIPYYEEGDFR